MNTVFGNIRFKRRLYLDRQTGKYVYLLDQHLRFEGRGKVSPHLLETAIAFAAEGPSYRDSARRLEQLLGYPLLSAMKPFEPIAVVHEGWEKNGKHVRLTNKQQYLHRSEGDFWEGFGDFLTEQYAINEDTWLVVGGDGARWIGECESYFPKCIYMLDRFHVARDLKRFVGHLPKIWKAARQALARQDPAALMVVVH